jgi:hypothetical protein
MAQPWQHGDVGATYAEQRHELQSRTNNDLF